MPGEGRELTGHSFKIAVQLVNSPNAGAETADHRSLPVPPRPSQAENALQYPGRCWRRRQGRAAS